MAASSTREAINLHGCTAWYYWSSWFRSLAGSLKCPWMHPTKVLSGDTTVVIFRVSVISHQIDLPDWPVESDYHYTDVFPRQISTNHLSSGSSECDFPGHCQSRQENPCKPGRWRQRSLTSSQPFMLSISLSTDTTGVSLRVIFYYLSVLIPHLPVCVCSPLLFTFWLLELALLTTEWTNEHPQQYVC